MVDSLTSQNPRLILRLRWSRSARPEVPILSGAKSASSPALLKKKPIYLSLWEDCNRRREYVGEAGYRSFRKKELMGRGSFGSCNGRCRLDRRPIGEVA